MNNRRTNRLALVINLVWNMGLRYVAFRILLEVQKRSGWLRKKFPVTVPTKAFIDLTKWREQTPPHFIQAREQITFAKQDNPLLTDLVVQMKKGVYPFFSSDPLELGQYYDWITNPSTGYQYDIQQHWADIPDLDPVKGDIKYVWELSRFAHLLPIIRHDYHADVDHGEWVFSMIDDWIVKNPINRGPNWRCSQEISLRTLNWTVALYYYQNHIALTPERFERITHIIYWQLKHVYAYINFSRIAVRNNHAITETLTLYLAGLLFPFFPEASRWKTAGKAWFEKEIRYQVYPDGSYLQHSMNYQRVVVQLLTWALRLTDLHGEKLQKVVLDRAQACLHFLSSWVQEPTGALPNYGSNDGALFFPFSSGKYRDYRPQLSALAAALGESLHFRSTSNCQEEIAWYGLPEPDQQKMADRFSSKRLQFDSGGYYGWKEQTSLSFIRCASYRDRPAQADNLHLDLWVNGQNILRDSGTFVYNEKPELLNFFWGTRGHNTISLGGSDQMYKGGRFIWFYWNKSQAIQIEEYTDHWKFMGEIQAFGHLASRITHQRTVTKYHNQYHWEVIDRVEHNTGLPLLQYWHLHPDFTTQVQLTATDLEGKQILLRKEPGWYSSAYGRKVSAPIWIFETHSPIIRTTIRLI